MVKQSDYQETAVQACLSVLLEIITVLGEFRDSVVLVGGNVPALLITSSREKHPGSLDVDLAFDFNNISEDTYSTVLESLSTAGYYQKPNQQPFIFYRDVRDAFGKTITVEVDLLAGEYGGTEAKHRTQTVRDAKARKARGVDLVFSSAVSIKLPGNLPDGDRTEVNIKVCSIGHFLVMKGMALTQRKKEKDAFDIYYCCKNYPGGVTALAVDMQPLLGNKLAQEGLSKIRKGFTTVDAIGPTWVTDFQEATDLEERDRVKREAFELVNRLMETLGITSCSD